MKQHGYLLLPIMVIVVIVAVNVKIIIRRR